MALFSHRSVKTCVLGAQKNRLRETVLLSTQNMFWLRNKKKNFCNTPLSGGLYYHQLEYEFLKINLKMM